MVADARVALAFASAAFYGRPSESVDVVGITGTNGKTTTAYLLDSICVAAGQRTGLIGTVETRIAGRALVQPAERPPNPPTCRRFSPRCGTRASTACAMEVSSHAIDLHRVDGMRFAVAAFTNLTQDHLDYHHTLEEYFSVKRRLFTDFDCEARVVNIDDPFGVGLANELGAD